MSKKHDDEKKKVSHHPCVYQYGSCAYGKDCRLYSYPGDTCLNYLRGRCTFKNNCRYRHDNVGAGGCIEKSDTIIEGIGTVKMNKKLGVIERDDNIRNKDQRPTINEYVNDRTQLNLVIDSGQDGTDMVYWEVGAGQQELPEEKPQPVPLMSQLEEFPSLGAAKAGKKKPNNNGQNLQVRTVDQSQPAEGFQLSASAVPWTPPGVENPYSFASRASQQSAPSSVWGSAPAAQVVKSTEPAKQQLHPCLRLFPTCKFGKECVYRNAPREACIMDLRGICKFGTDCKDLHTAPKA
eukprot:TRINITY_DN21116_c0_g1_i1.p1 TRINITY_DN21116_c0_g1~~TRINITY_DN21116_c0_g1_i1.p1  ORF type:complete len:293 (+),score=35.31 TRINITY_DN21116_c0_g1_i1:212-1090(+)